jgi:sugar-specific transcriptional regulator TrmB
MRLLLVFFLGCTLRASAAMTLVGSQVRVPVEDFIAAAKESLIVELPCLNDLRLESALARAAKRGVKVRLLLSPRFKSNNSSVRRFKNSGVRLRWSDSNARFIAADSCRMLLGSFNGLASSLDEKVESLVIEEAWSPGLQDLENAFEDQWEKARGFSMEGLELGDALKALPSPQGSQEKQPRVNTTRRIQ